MKMNEIQHSKEPWKWHAQGEANEHCLLTNDDRWVIAFRQNGELYDAEQIANARRIVACVNACAGLTTAELELAAIFGERLQAKLVGAKYKQQRDALVAAIQQTLDENGHLADGDNCTLIVLKRALESVGAAQVVNCSTCRFRETKEPCRGCYEYHAWQPEKSF